MADNRTGLFVKRHQRQKDTRPAVERFLDGLTYIDECWIFKKGADQIQVKPGLVISPWRFSWEIHHGIPAPKHARFKWKCETAGCCNPEHMILNKTIQT